MPHLDLAPLSSNVIPHRRSALIDADPEREEPESYTWTVLHPDNWRKETNLGWRFAASELAERREAARDKPESPEKRRKR